jgi:hypothetical protein
MEGSSLLRARHRKILIAGTTVSAIGGTAAISVFATRDAAPAAASPAPIPAPLLRFAEQQHVTMLRRHGPTGIVWLTGTDARGHRVIAVGTGDAMSPFGPIERFQRSLAATKLLVFTSDSGPTLDTLGRRVVGGLVASDVTRVEARVQGGDVQPVALTDGAFAYTTAITREHFPTAVVGYDEAGSIVASKALSQPSPPRSG